MSEEYRDTLKIPAHIAIIMDGNGRWAKRRGMPRTFGHSQGAKVVEQILEDADHMGVKYLTVYAFSTENWARPQTEVKALMNDKDPRIWRAFAMKEIYGESVDVIKEELGVSAPRVYQFVAEAQAIGRQYRKDNP